MQWGTLCNVASDPLTATGDVWPASSAEGTPGGCGGDSNTPPEAVAGSSQPATGAIPGYPNALQEADAGSAPDAVQVAEIDLEGCGSQRL